MVRLAELIMHNPDDFCGCEVDVDYVLSAPFLGLCLLRLLDFEESRTLFEPQIDRTFQSVD